MAKKIDSHERCPKCGGYSVRFKYTGHFQVVCNDCGHAGGLEESREFAMQQWNREERTGK